MIPTPAGTPGERHTCEASVWARGYYYPNTCGKTAKVERDGKWYCGIHDPVRLDEKRAVRDAEFDRKYAADKQRRQLEQAAPALYEALKALTEAAEFDFDGESTANCGDDECVAMADGSAFTFGMIRRARAALAKADGK